MVRKVIIAGAAGRDFHNFNLLYRSRADVEVVAFTATQIPRIEGRRYPPELAGSHYPQGIPIEPEERLEDLIRQHAVDVVDFAYSDVSHEDVMHLASRALAAGADFQFHAPRQTSLAASVPVVSICAVRTGCGKSQTAQAVCRILLETGRRVVAMRHPMPYGNLSAQAVQRFAKLDDLRQNHCTVEEREEYESYLRAGMVIYAGVDYQRILDQAQNEADVIVWDGGNNDTAFVRSNLAIVVLDPLRAGHERRFHPGEVNLLSADLFLVNKIDQASPEQLGDLRKTIERYNPHAPIIWARSELSIDEPTAISGKRVLVVEDGPTTTHGGMAYGAGLVAARFHGAGQIVDPRPFAIGSLAAAYKKYPHLGAVVPALGYYDEQLSDLQETINGSDADVVVSATPIDLTELISIGKPVVRVSYRLGEEALQLLRAAIFDRLLGAGGAQTPGQDQ